MVRCRKIWGAVAALGVCCCLLPGAFAAADTTKSKAEFEQTFQKMLKDPGNAELTLRYSNLATELGDYEAAIPPLERLLMFNPNLPDIKLKLGVLYHKLGSNDIARTYFEDVAGGKDAASQVALDAKRYLEKL